MNAGTALRLAVPFSCWLGALLACSIPWWLERGKLPREERAPWYTWTLTVPCFVATVAIWLPFALGEKERIAEERARATQEKRAEKAEEDAAALTKRVEHLTSTLEPFRRAARAKFPGLDEEEALQRFGQNAAKLIPKLEEFKDERVVDVDPKTGMATTTYVLGSRSVVPLTEVSVEIENDVVMRHVEATASMERLWGSAKKGILDKGKYTVSPDARKFRFSVDFLEAGTRMEVKVQTVQRPTVFNVKALP
ncbi:MAG: hypothetical protein ISS72_10890 [Candidatus Brocadiae bacterium]|nr:hypothetical protein [Candidatus Brocadiia bacterium]